MLEVVNLTKIYTTKTHAEVKALDGVTLRFPDKGMVFLLGKSGSGKSTLLNLCGGLDAPTGGEVIVKGRSSKDFSQSDFDSYRNTFVGFVFQEYNILNEFSVEDNVSLALELQGKPKDRKTVHALLKQVDLDGYAKRKPNTLSGGQKQRIAIARALVKSPEIIMADEPTGALDSATGKQVLDTLKKLSADKLVLVVSHDREFAEQYGDRVIELKDGKVISDVSKEQEAQQSLSENLSAVGNTLCVKDGSSLTEKDFETIRTFLKAASSPAVIASGEADVKTYKTAARITDKGEKEVFRDTQNDAIALKSYTEKDSRFIRSRLPMRHAAKIGLSGLKYKPFRLFFTIILCTVAFTLFGLLSTMTFYNSKDAFRQTLKDSHPDVVRLLKTYRTTLNEYEYGELLNTYYHTQDAAFSSEEVAALSQRFGVDAFAAETYYGALNFNNYSRYYSGELNYAAFVPEGHALRKTIVGEYPTAKNEVAISSYLAQGIIACGAKDAAGADVTAKTFADLCGTTIYLGNKHTYVITGVFSSGKLDEKYDALKETTLDEELVRLERQFRSEISDGLHTLLCVSQAGIQNFTSNHYYSDYDEFENHVIAFYDENGQEQAYGHYGAVTNYLASTVFFAQDKTAPGENEAIVSAEWWVKNVFPVIEDRKITAENALYNLDLSFVSRVIAANDAYDDWGATVLLDNWKWGSQIPEESDPLYSVYIDFTAEAAPLLAEVEQYQTLLQKANVILYGQEYENGVWTQAYAQERAACLADLLAASQNFPTQTITFRLLDCHYGMPMGDSCTVTAVGVCDFGSGKKTTLLLSQAQTDSLWQAQKTGSPFLVESQTNYRKPDSSMGGYLFLSYHGSNRETNALSDLYFSDAFDENDSRMQIYSDFAESFAVVDDFVNSTAKVFLYVGLVFAAFAVLLLSNFISVSISYKKKEIGILRAVGARSTDVFKIFFSESAFITLLCVMISTALSIVVCGVLNAEVASGLGASIFVFGVLSFIVLVGIALAACVGATFLPVFAAARKKPVDSIRAL